MSTLDGALLSDEASRPQRIFEGDLVVPLMSPWLALADLLRLAQTNRACMREISIGVREIGLTEFECPVPLTVRGTQALVSFAPLAFKLFCAARQNAVLRRSPL